MTKNKHHFNLFTSLSGVLTLLACLPVIALVLTAIQGNSDIFGHLIQYVLPLLWLIPVFYYLVLVYSRF